MSFATIGNEGKLDKAFYRPQRLPTMAIVGSGLLESAGKEVDFILHGKICWAYDLRPPPIQHGYAEFGKGIGRSPEAHLGA